MRRGLTVGGGFGLAALIGIGWGWHAIGEAQPRAPVARGEAALVERGRYLVNVVARCGDCHTPRNARGKLDFSRPVAIMLPSASSDYGLA